MAKGKKTGGRNFVKGHPGGPGRPKMPDDFKVAWGQIQTIRNETRYEFANAYKKVQEYSVEMLQAFVKKTDTAVVELLVARCLLGVLSKAKVQDVAQLQELMCGPEPKHVELSGPNGEPLSPVTKLSTEELAQAYAALQDLAEKKKK